MAASAALRSSDTMSRNPVPSTMRKLGKRSFMLSQMLLCRLGTCQMVFRASCSSPKTLEAPNSNMTTQRIPTIVPIAWPVRGLKYCLDFFGAALTNQSADLFHYGPLGSLRSEHQSGNGYGNDEERRNRKYGVVRRAAPRRGALSSVQWENVSLNKAPSNKFRTREFPPCRGRISEEHPSHS